MGRERSEEAVEGGIGRAERRGRRREMRGENARNGRADGDGRHGKEDEKEKGGNGKERRGWKERGRGKSGWGGGRG